MSEKTKKLREFTGRSRVYEMACDPEESTRYIGKYTKIVTTNTRIFIKRQRELDCGHWANSKEGDKRIKAHCTLCDYPNDLELQESWYGKSLR